MPSDGPVNESPKTIVLGLGNPILRDDGVGLRVVALLAGQLVDRRDITVDEDHWGGLQLMERITGFDRAIIVDAMQIGASPGTVVEFGPSEISTQRSASSHDVNFPTALALGRELSLHLPDDEHILLVGIEATDILTFGEGCTPEVEAAIPVAVNRVLEILERWRNEDSNGDDTAVGARSAAADDGNALQDLDSTPKSS